MYFLKIIVNMFQTFNFVFVECCAIIDKEETKDCPRKIKIMKDVNDDKLIVNSFGMVLRVNEKGENFFKP
jgi:hypothetical protein